MADDIVTRLRNKYQRQLPILLEAADEIERLRIDINDLQNIIQLLKEAEND